MNKFSCFLATFALLFSLSGFAQKSPKFGHINSAELLSLRPERKAAMAKMDSVTKEAEKLLQEMMTEYRTEQDKYTAESG
ncbi:MAG: OmpH family outer membrane protein, partial [Bacteroidia bacterium]